ncbi:MAG: MBL fold metallo-hydrolase [Phycisphaerales bacterium]|nr:MAG: MBL fold metallo-hydrolase [Phycisphaerales bacterium]
MKIDHLILGAYETNSYVLRLNDASRDCLIIDTGLNADRLIDFLTERKLNPVAIVLTHGHVDHIGGLVAMRGKFHAVKVYIHKLDAEMLTEPRSNLSGMTGMPFRTEPEDFTLAENDVVERAGIELLVFHTPGHTPGGICLYSKKNGVAFVGDTLFADSVGRTDFPGGSMPQLISSIKEKLFVLPDETKIYPGHGPATTIGHEKVYNPFMR